MKRMVLLLTLVLHASLAQACSVPVFRYALEQWRPDPFPVVVFHKGEVTPELKALIARIEPVLDEKTKSLPNAWVELVNLDTATEPERLELWGKQNSETLPWMAVLSPQKFGPPAQVLGAEFNEEQVDRLLNSPARTEITKRLIAGHSTVWVLLEGGNKDKDNAAFETLTVELKRLQSELKLPEIEEQDIADGFLSIEPEELKLKFSVVRVSRDDEKESALVQMLLNTEPDLRDPQFDGQPMALPVFGRGRVLYALIDKGINTEVITDTCTFLTGACQCTVKAQSPGVDMLTSVDWDSHISPMYEEDSALPPLTGLAGFGDPVEAEEPEDPDSPSDATASTPAPSSADESTPAETVQVAAAATSVPSTRSVSASGFGMGKFAIFFVGGLAVVAAGLSLVFAPREK
jgi:hypothetical protein